MRFYTTNPKPGYSSYFIYGVDEDATGITPSGDKWRGLVICKLVDTSFDVRDFVSTLGGKRSHLEVDLKAESAWKKDLLIENEYVGRARCSVEDVFDLEKGMEIARNRALASYRKDKYKELMKIVFDLGVIVNQVYKEIDFLAKKKK